MKPLVAKFGSNARPQNPRSSKVFTLDEMSRNGVGSTLPFLMMRMTPFFCHTKMRPSGANAIPTSENGLNVATVSVVNAGSVKSSADARCGCMTSRAATTTNTMNRLSYAMNLPRSADCASSPRSRFIGMCLCAGRRRIGSPVESDERCRGLTPGV
jgi:hypothetical protein